eukprot:TRINITY_DN16646_c0_g1_i2.p1 TRINITY_DN16646_c0_g1~~TRINITY_DN16646_c0_g1_i2.p1  ORF type:complete len:167 (+),score=14.98 TRINITY_DN16646_c0_g1_i2:38-538(+)
MLLQLVLACLLGLAWSQCGCPVFDCTYTGSQAQCFCWAQGYANSQHTTGSVTYFPWGTFSTGGCKYCSSGASSQTVQFLVSVAYCSGGTHTDVGGLPVCNAYIGDYNSCTNYCSQTAKSMGFVGTYSCSYMPSGTFNFASCRVSGYKDPCTVFGNYHPETNTTHMN